MTTSNERTPGLVEKIEAERDEVLICLRELRGLLHQNQSRRADGPLDRAIAHLADAHEDLGFAVDRLEKPSANERRAAYNREYYKQEKQRQEARKAGNQQATQDAAVVLPSTSTDPDKLVRVLMEAARGAINAWFADYGTSQSRTKRMNPAMTLLQSAYHQIAEGR